MMVGCSRPAVPARWAEYGLPIERGEITTEYSEPPSNEVVTFVHAELTAYGPLCQAYIEHFRAREFEQTLLNDLEGSVMVIMTKGDESISLDCSILKEDSVRVGLRHSATPS